MAADRDEPAPPSAGADDQPCMACRGTGRVTSTLGGEPKSVECPWCKGTGRRIPGNDAQSRWRQGGEEAPEGEGQDAPPPEEPDPAA